MANNIPGINFKGGAAGGGVADQLESAELGLPYTDSQNTIIDTFNTDLGSKIHLSASNSRLQFDAGQTTGSYIRSKITSAPMTSVLGRVVAELQMVKPQATVISASTVVYDGDVSGLFSSSSRLFIGRLEDSDGVKVMRHLLNTQGKLAVFDITSVTYSLINDETTIVITNPDSLDLNVGLTVAQDVADKLRFMPFDWDISVSSDDSHTWDVTDIDEAMLYGNGTIGIPGEGYFSNSSGLVGRILNQVTVRSANGQYVLKKSLEARVGNDYYVFEFSTDKGKTWSYFGGSKASSEYDSGVEHSNGLDGAWQCGHDQDMFIANNGKFFITYYLFSTYTVRGYYGDASAPSPTLIASPDSGLGVGIVNTGGGTHIKGTVAGDPVDGSYIATHIVYAISGNSYVFSYNNYGGTFLGIASHSSYGPTLPPVALRVTGTGTSHRAYVGYDNGGGGLDVRYIDENTPTSISAASTIASQAWVLGSAMTANYFVVFSTTPSAPYFIVISYTANTGSISLTSKTLRYNDSTDLYQGFRSTVVTNLLRYYNSKVVVDPNNEKHLFFTTESYAGDLVRKSYIYEIPDFTTLTGMTLYQTTANTGYGIRYSTSQQKLGQTFQAPSTKIETVIIAAYQVSSSLMTSGKYLWAELWETSGGLPSTKIANSDNQYESSYLTKSTAGQVLCFNFPRSLTFTPGTTYAVVLDADYDISTTEYVMVIENTTSVYANGTRVDYNGTSWSSSTRDLIFYVSDHRITDAGNATENTVSNIPGTLHNFESSLALLDNSTIQYITRRAYGSGSADYFYMSGHPYRRLININSGSEATITDLLPVSLVNQFDPNIMINVSLGAETSYNRNLDTGAITGEAQQMRSGYPLTLANGGTFSRVADTDFESGYCYDLQASSYVRYGDTTINIISHIASIRDFSIELEIKLVSSTGSVRNLCTCLDSTDGWALQINSSGYMQFVAVVSSSPTTTAVSDKVEPLTYHKVRVTRKNGTIKLWRNEGGGWNEAASYSSTAASNKNWAYGSGQYFMIGGANGGVGSPVMGKIGYCRMMSTQVGRLNETFPFAYEGFKDQSAIISLRNTGNMIYGENIVGNATTYAVSYDEPVQSSGQESALVDSYTQQLKISHDIAPASQGQNCNLKIDMARVSDEDQSRIAGLQFDYSK